MVHESRPCVRAMVHHTSCVSPSHQLLGLNRQLECVAGLLRCVALGHKPTSHVEDRTWGFAIALGYRCWCWCWCWHWCWHWWCPRRCFLLDLHPKREIVLSQPYQGGFRIDHAVTLRDVAIVFQNRIVFENQCRTHVHTMLSQLVCNLAAGLPTCGHFFTLAHTLTTFQ